MNKNFRSTRDVLLVAVILLCSCKPSHQESSADLPIEVTSFAARKEAQAKALAERFNLNVASDVWRYFAAAKEGNWPAVSRLWDKLHKRAGQYAGSKADPAVTSEVWQTVLETELACEQFALGEPKYAKAFGLDIIRSVPAGSIYFGGTDPGRGLVTALCKSQETGDPFFTITQNALADNLYLNYLREIYGHQIYIPSKEDSQKAFQEYLEDAQKRLQNGKLKPGEDVKIVNNRVQVSGQVAVMAINGLLAKVIFEKNPKPEFFIEESFPLDWMYPHLVPHGLIMEVRREPLLSIAPEVVEKDTREWSQRVSEMLGDWLKPETPVKDVCAFSDQVFARRDMSRFKGDVKYVVNTNACAMFSKLRSSIAGIYAWRATGADDPIEKKRMIEAADFGFRQAFALCPYSPEAVFRYVNLLSSKARSEDALRVAEAASNVDPNNAQLKTLVQQLRKGKAPRDDQ